MAVAVVGVVPVLIRYDGAYGGWFLAYGASAAIGEGHRGRGEQAWVTCVPRRLRDDPEGPTIRRLMRPRAAESLARVVSGLVVP